MKIGYQGVKGSFSYIATKELYPNEQMVNFWSFREVFEALECSKIDIGIIPIENSYTGKVEDTNLLMNDFNFKILKKINIPIHHNLAGIEGATLDVITHIFSHKQALLQCKENIKKIIPKAQLVEKENTAISAHFVANAKNNNYACLCSSESIKEYGLKNLYPNLQDKNNNHTLFVAISK